MKIGFLILSFICPSILVAQYITPQQAQSAYQWGYNLGIQQQKQNQAAYNMGYCMGLVQNGQRLIAEGKYRDGFEKFEEAWEEYHYYPALECLGCCYELGIGVDRDVNMADVYYEEGADHNEPNCKAAIRRINSKGHYSQSYKNTLISNLKSRFGVGTSNYNNGGLYLSPSVTSSTNGNIEVDHSCRACDNTGQCPGCRNHPGYEYGTTRCKMCRGTAKCPNCGGKGWR